MKTTLKKSNNFGNRTLFRHNMAQFFVDKKTYKIETKNNQTFVSIDYNNQDFEENNINEYYPLNSQQPLIDFFFNLGIDIPHYCYHQTFSIAKNCRMCLVRLKIFINIC